MSEFGVSTEPGTVRFERVLPGPIERVWTYLTDSEKRGKWLATGPMDLHVGGAVALTFLHTDLSPRHVAPPERYKAYEKGVTTHGRITRCEPPNILAYTWGGGDDSNGESEVTFELAPRGAEVLLVLTHRRLASRDAMVEVAGGWHTHLGVLVEHLSGEEPQPFWSAWERIEGEYEKRIPKT